MGLQNVLSEDSPGVELDGDFRRALSAMEGTSGNLFITGEAGTGKSTLLAYFRRTTSKNIAVLAPTGVAALNVRGQTIHSFFRFRPDITPDTVRKLNPYAARKYRSVDAIVIDEISMVRADLLDCIDQFMRLNGRDRSLPFGGAQMILLGDLYQLPPVVTEGERGIFKGHYRSPYFFDSRAFEGLRFRFIELATHYRQKDARTVELFDAIRNNSFTDAHIRELNSRYDPDFVPKDTEMYITLTTTNRLADAINGKRLAQIAGREYSYGARASGELDRKALPADERLVIKENAQVMMLNNDPERRWVNGSIGRVVCVSQQEGEDDIIIVGFADGTQACVTPYAWKLFKFSYDTAAGRLKSEPMGGFVQYPLTLAWAVTIHKSQGKTFDRVIIDLGEGTFAHGQLYVALSRCRTLGGIVLRKRIERRHVFVDQRIVDFLAECKKRGA
jgi:ATP-dependent exoDNAse (exonuclease V) alpha subunit